MRTATEYKIGDRVVIKSNGGAKMGAHGFKKGEIATISEIFSNCYEARSNRCHWYVDDQDISGRAKS